MIGGFNLGGIASFLTYGGFFGGVAGAFIAAILMAIWATAFVWVFYSKHLKNSNILIAEPRNSRQKLSHPEP